jgi:hypothetical protein
MGIKEEESRVRLTQRDVVAIDMARVKAEMLTDKVSLVPLYKLYAARGSVRQQRERLDVIMVSNPSGFGFIKLL